MVSAPEAKEQAPATEAVPASLEVKVMLWVVSVPLVGEVIDERDGAVLSATHRGNVAAPLRADEVYC